MNALKIRLNRKLYMCNVPEVLLSLRQAHWRLHEFGILFYTVYIAFELACTYDELQVLLNIRDIS